MADLSQLFQVAPGTASFFTGQQFAQDRAMNELKQRELADLIAQRQAQEGRAGELHPFELEKAGLANQTSRAHLPGIQADSTLRGYKAKMAGENYDVDSAAARAKAEGDVVDERVKKAQRIQGFLADVGPELEYVPPALRTQHFRSRIEQAGFDPNNPQVQRTMQIVAQNPEKASAILKQLNDQIGSQMADRTQPHQTAKLNNESAERRAAESAKTQRAVAKTYAAGRGGKANLPPIEQLRLSKSAKQTAEIARAGLVEASTMDDNDPDKPKAIKFWEDIYFAARETSIEDDKSRGGAKPGMDMEAAQKGDLHYRPPVEATAPPTRGSAPGAPRAAAPATDIKSLVEARGEQYDPSKFEYRINPQTGRVQSRPKQ